MAAIDFGLLGALRGRDDWKSRKQEKQNELQYQGVINRILQEENAANQQKQQAIAEYMDTANRLEVLPVGMQRIQNINEPLKASIAENIKKFGGDLDKYWKVQGRVDMQNYLNQLMHNPVTTREMMNASAAARWKADKDSGRQERGVVDPETGNLVNPFEQQLHQYNSGEIDQLNYSGAFDRQDFDPKVFTQFYGDPKDPYKVVPVGVATFRDFAYNDFKGKGMSDTDARQQAEEMAAQYARAMKQPGFQPYTFKHDQRPRPLASWGNDQNAYISARFTVDQLDAVSSPAYNKWVKPKEVMVGLIDEKTGKQIGTKKAIQTEADMVPISLGKKTITVQEQKDKYTYKNGIPVPDGTETKEVTKEIDDAIEPILLIGGKKYIQTTANRLEGKKPVPFESKAANKIILAAPNTPDGLRMKAAYRRVLKEKGVLDSEGVIDFDLNNPQQRYVDAAGNTVVDVDKLTPEQLQSLIDAGTITIAE